MSLGQPDLHIGTTRMQDLAADSRPVLGGLTFKWGGDSYIEFEKPGTLSGEMLIKAQQDLSFLTAGQPVGLVDPASSQTLFAGRLETLSARPDEKIRSALRVAFTASDTTTELLNVKAFGIDWPMNDSGANRQAQIAAKLPPGWTMPGGTGYTSDWGATWMKFNSIGFLELLDMYCRGHLARRHNTTLYTPGVGLSRRMTITPERQRIASHPFTLAGTAGVWDTTSGGKPTEATGLAVLPPGVVSRDVEWEKTPDDTITDVVLKGWAYPVAGEPEDESSSSTFEMSYYVNNSANISKYGHRQLELQTDLRYILNSQPQGAQIINFWLDVDTKWRATQVTIPDSRVVDTAAFRQLISAHTRHMAVLAIKGIAGLVPTADAMIHAYVIGGSATWTGKKWTAQLTLGRGLDLYNPQ